MTDFFDHDHPAEAAFLDFVASPTPENARAAELAVAVLQRGVRTRNVRGGVE